MRDVCGLRPPAPKGAGSKSTSQIQIFLASHFDKKEIWDLGCAFDKKERCYHLCFTAPEDANDNIAPFYLRTRAGLQHPWQTQRAPALRRTVCRPVIKGLNPIQFMLLSVPAWKKKETLIHQLDGN